MANRIAILFALAAVVGGAWLLRAHDRSHQIPGPVAPASAAALASVAAAEPITRRPAPPHTADPQDARLASSNGQPPRPALPDRLQRFEAKWGHRVTNAQRVALQSAGRLARALKTGGTLTPDRRARRADASAAIRDVHAALHPQVRAALRRHRITPYQLARAQR